MPRTCFPAATPKLLIGGRHGSCPRCSNARAAGSTGAHAGAARIRRGIVAFSCVDERHRRLLLAEVLRTNEGRGHWVAQEGETWGVVRQGAVLRQRTTQRSVESEERRARRSRTDMCRQGPLDREVLHPVPTQPVATTHPAAVLITCSIDWH